MKSDKNHNLESIELFLSKIYEIKNSSYFDFVKMNRINAIINYNLISGISLSENQPTEEALKSLILTLRLFIQNNDRISISNVSRIMEELNFDNTVIDKYNNSRRNLNRDLESVAVIYNNESITYNKIIEVFIYGYYSHLDNQNYQYYKNWKNSKYVLAFKKVDLLHAINNILRFLLSIEEMVKNEFIKASGDSNVHV